MPYAPEYLHLVIPGVKFEADLYGRNSDDGGGGGSSVEDQLATARATCKEYGWRVRREYNDTDLSASRHGRKARGDFEALIASMTEEPPAPGTRRIVLAFEASRYYRDLEAYVRLRAACTAAGVLLYYDGKVYDLSRRDDRKATAQHAIDAEDEADAIQVRNVRTMRRTAAEGMPHGKAIYGYTRTYEVVNGRRRCTGQEENPKQSTYVVQTIQRADAGHSIKALVRWLSSEEGAVRHDGHPWTVYNVKSLLLNRSYLGERMHQREWVPAAWSPLKALDSPEGRAMVNRVIARIKDPSRRTQRGTEPTHLLSYIALCGECGDHAVLRWLSASSRRSATLHCSEKLDTSIQETAIDAFVEEALLDWYADKGKARAALVPTDDKVKEQASAVQRLINSLDEQLTEARLLAQEFDAEAGRFKLSAASLAGMESKLEPQLAAARKKLQSFTGVSPLQLGMLEARDPDLLWNGHVDDEGRVVVEGLTLEQKRELIRSTVTVRLYKAKRGSRAPIHEGRIGLAFVGEPGFRDRRSRAPESAPVPAPRRAPASGTG